MAKYGSHWYTRCRWGINIDGKISLTFYSDWNISKDNYRKMYGDTSYIFAHEAAYAYDLNNNDISSSSKWKTAMEKDNNFVSQYAINSYYQREGKEKYNEDFAKDVAYIDTYGKENFEKYFPNRAKVIKEIFPSYFK